MELINFSDSPQKYRPDILFTNKNEDIVLLVEIKSKKLEPSLKKNAMFQLTTYLENIKKNIPFGMLVDLEEINIFSLTEEQNIKDSISLKTNDILSTYDSEFSQKRIFDFYLETLVKSWLRDLSYHWHSETPPGYHELIKIGLLPLLEGGHTYIQENLGVDTLH
ncbi:type I restriction enzyme HsdR N-terminal domain-containing protein [Trichormus sp. NMC-1]|uniref:type I restriction enzyme HsdR N-terminal domain-containing protein n=1 Tax=Trichormus sp. NMC-1 TaxID=1853259 RepID=UPI0008DC2408|nr:type I restriction enzyme HsdR N-terminal domain-containing protein [Trichormus sp. NMC-1]